MHKRFLGAFGFLLIVLSIHAQSPREKGLKSITQHSAEAIVGFLADDELEGREAGQHGSRLAARYIVSRLKETGIAPWDSLGYFQPFEGYRKERQQKGCWEVDPDSIATIKEGVHRCLSMGNVLGVVPGKRQDEFVVVGAHFDHLGTDPALVDDQIYNGADDNASGVSAVLQIAKAFMETGKQPLRTVIFAFWDGEEIGLLGSKYFTQTFPSIERVKGYLNFDMIGRNTDNARPEHVVYFYTASHPVFGEWLKEDIHQYGFRLQPDYRSWDKPVDGSDNASFARFEVPIIWYHTDGHPDYHQPSDHADKLNFEKLTYITKAAFLNAWNLANETDY